jgi:N-acetylmuramoyl-L-alanine amidase
VRHSISQGRTRVVIDLSARAEYKIYRVARPERIAVNLPNTRLAKSIRSVDVEGSLVKRVRVNRLSWGSQVVIDLSRKATWSDFYLAAVENMPNRIVVDVLTPAAVQAPKLAGKAKGPVKTAGTGVGKPAKRRDLVVAIDAGHGGTDPGTRGHGIVEKRAALDIARRLAREINAQPGYKAVLTRTKDVFISLPRRSKIAQNKNADIFVSVHLNSAPRRSARGSEVYFLSPGGAATTAKRLLRNKSRAARELGIQGAGSDDIIHMLVDINQQAMMRKSSYLAEEILKALGGKGLPPDRSIKQRSFVVLKSIAMPSVMVETGFVTNSKDATILKSDTGRKRLAKAISRGVISFLKKYPPPTEETGRIFVHRVKKGDTLWKISREYRTSVDSIQRSNRLGKSKLIRIGQELVIREGYAAY